ncbi:hypothetical protein GCM10009540_32430 [Streptomyces turgidiscabies]
MRREMGARLLSWVSLAGTALVSTCAVWVIAAPEREWATAGRGGTIARTGQCGPTGDDEKR